MAIAAANVHDSKVSLRPIGSIPPIRHGAGRLGNRPKELKGDPAYDLELLRGELRKGGTEPLPNGR
jgi:hypothetical protein